MWLLICPSFNERTCFTRFIRPKQVQGYLKFIVISQYLTRFFNLFVGEKIVQKILPPPLTAVLICFFSAKQS